MTMGNIHLVTGYAGVEHVAATDQGAFNASVFGRDQVVLAGGNNLAATVVTNNQIRVLDGDILMQGRHIRLNPGTYVDLAIENGTQGYLRYDLIVARYTKNSITGVEDCNLVVIKGENATANPTVPNATFGNIYDGGALQNDMLLYLVPLNGLTIGELEPQFSVVDDIYKIIENHSGDVANPHRVTKEQVGLGNVPNVNTNNQTPTYTVASAIAALKSGEKMSVAFGKIAKAVADLISHLANKSNPHGVTAAQAGAVPTTRTVNGKALTNDISLVAADVGACSTAQYNIRAYTDITQIGLADASLSATDFLSNCGSIFTALNGRGILSIAISSGTNLCQSILAKLKTDANFTVGSYLDVQFFRSGANMLQIDVVPQYYTANNLYPAYCYSCVFRYAADSAGYLSPFVATRNLDGFVSKAGDTISGASNPTLHIANSTNGRILRFRSNNNNNTFLLNYKDDDNYQGFLIQPESSELKTALQLCKRLPDATKIFNLLHMGNLADCGVLSVVTGTYSGGGSNEKALTLPTGFDPQLLIVSGEGMQGRIILPAFALTADYSRNAFYTYTSEYEGLNMEVGYYAKKVGNVLTWKSDRNDGTSDSDNIKYAANTSGVTYTYWCIGLQGV